MADHHCIRHHNGDCFIEFDDLSGLGSSDGPAEEIHRCARFRIQITVRIILNNISRSLTPVQADRPCHTACSVYCCGTQLCKPDSGRNPGKHFGRSPIGLESHISNDSVPQILCGQSWYRVYGWWDLGQDHCQFSRICCW